MMIKIAACLLAVGFLAACESTKTTTKRETLREMTARYASNSSTSSTEPAPPAEGPEDVPADRRFDIDGNPALVPTPLLRDNAAGDL
jgi:hypothetical protein